MSGAITPGLHASFSYTVEFAVRVDDAGRVAASGRITRVLVDLERFLAGMAARR